MQNRIVFRNLKEIDRAAESFLDKIGNYKVIALYGSMGAGKTTFTKALCKEMRVTDALNTPT